MLILSFSHSIFKPFRGKLNHLSFVLIYCVQINAFQFQLTHSHTMTPFDVSGKEAFFENIVGKEKMLVTSIFSFSHNVFYSIKDRNYHLCYIHFVVCRCYQFGQGQIFVIWEWVKCEILSCDNKFIDLNTCSKVFV